MEYLGIHLLVKRRDTTITNVERWFETRITLLNIIMLVYVWRGSFCVKCSYWLGTMVRSSYCETTLHFFVVCFIYRDATIKCACMTNMDRLQWEFANNLQGFSLFHESFLGGFAVLQLNHRMYHRAIPANAAPAWWEHMRAHLLWSFLIVMSYDPLNWYMCIRYIIYR